MSNTPALTKEAILAKHEGCPVEAIEDSERIRIGQDVILPAMEEFARQECIEFAKWIRDNALIAEDGERWKILGPDYNLIVNESQLYDYFTEQRNKQES